MNGTGKLLWGWYKAGDPPVWVPIQVDANGKVIVDMSAINLNDLADVSVASPTDGYILYWDNATSLWKCKAHTALTTGVHGVGAKHVARSSVATLDLASHDTRHEFLGADEIRLTDLLGRYIQVVFDWQTHDGWTEAHTETGSVTWELTKTLVRTGATINSISKAYTATMGVGYHIHPGRSAADAWSVDSYINGLANSLVWLGYFASTTPSDTDRHIGWKIIDGEIWASNSDGVNQTITDTGVSIAAAFTDKRLLIIAGTTSIKFYVNLVLKATHTTNLPGGGTLRNMMYVTNTAASDRTVRVYFATVSMSSQY